MLHAWQCLPLEASLASAVMLAQAVLVQQQLIVPRVRLALGLRLLPVLLEALWLLLVLDLLALGLISGGPRGTCLEETPTGSGALSLCQRSLRLHRLPVRLRRALVGRERAVILVQRGLNLMLMQLHRATVSLLDLGSALPVPWTRMVQWVPVSWHCVTRCRAHSWGTLSDVLYALCQVLSSTEQGTMTPCTGQDTALEVAVNTPPFVREL